MVPLLERRAAGLQIFSTIPSPKDNAAAYRILRERGGSVSGAQSASTYALQLAGFAATNTNSAGGAFSFDPARYAVPGLTTKCEMGLHITPNTIDPLATFTIGLYPITGVGGNTTASITLTTGTLVSGSTVALQPGAGSGILPGVRASSGDFTPPASGIYAILMNLSQNQAANSLVLVRATLSFRNV